MAALGLDSAAIERLTTSRKVQQRARVVATRDGVVARLDVREGAYVSPASQIMAIADLSDVWVIAEVFERQAGWIVAGLSAEVELEALPGTTLNAELTTFIRSLI